MSGNTERRHYATRLWRAGWVLPVCLTAAIQLIFVLQTDRYPGFRFPLVDAATYHQQAMRAAAGDPLAPGVFWQPPLYPFVLSLLYRVGVTDGLLVRGVHSLLAVAAAGLTFGVARLLLGRKRAVVAGCLAAVHGPLLFFASQLLPAALAAVWNLAALGTACMLLRRRRWPWAAATGLLVGLGALTVPNVLLVLPVLLVFIPVVYRRTATAGAVRAAVCVVGGCALVILPVSVRNRVVGGEWVLISTNGGVNLYLGNNPAREQTVAARPGIDWDRLVSTPLREGTARTASQSQRDFLRRVVRYVRAQPLDFLRGLGIKAFQLVNGVEIPRNLDIYTFRSDAPLLRVLVWRWGSFGFPMGLLMPLALLGTAVLWRRGPEASLLSAWILVYIASVVLFFPTSRYALPIVPALLIAAVAGAQRIGSDLVRPGRPDLRTGGGFLLLLVLCNLPVSLPATEVDVAAERQLYHGVALQTRGRHAEALAAYEKVLEERPAYADAWFYRGTLLRELGRADEAIASHREALRLRPDHYRAMNDLAVLLFRRKDVADAVALLRESVALDPLNRDTVRNLVVGLVAMGKIEEANTWRARLGEPPLRVH